MLPRTRLVVTACAGLALSLSAAAGIASATPDASATLQPYMPVIFQVAKNCNNY